MGKNRTPLLAPMRKSSATLYTFPSSVEDIGLNINERNNKVVLSHYVTLNIPTIKNEESAEGSDAAMYLKNIAGASYSETDKTIWLRDSLQNYVMNFETIIRNQNSYDFSASATVSEKIFWKWMQKIGALSLPEENVINKVRFYHEDWTEYDSNIIKGFGNISTSSQQSNSYNTATKTYIMIPSSYGQMKCLLKATSDNNYERGLDYYATNNTSLEGYDDDLHYGYFDTTDDGGFGKYKVSDYKHTLNFSFDTVDYMNVLNSLTSDANLQLIKKPSIDDLAIDKSLRLGDSYDFNAILVYYSIFDSAGNAVATNLFGVMFLNGLTENEDGTAFIEPYTKKSSNDGDFGSSFSFVLDMKTAAIYDNTQAPIIDYSSGDSAYMEDFNGVIANLNEAMIILQQNAAILAKSYNDTNTIKELYAETNDRYAQIEKDLKTILRLFDPETIDASFGYLFNGLEEIKQTLEELPTFDENNYYDKQASDERYAQISETYDKNSADETFQKKSDSYTKTDADNTFIKKSELDITQVITQETGSQIFTTKEELENAVVAILIKYGLIPGEEATPLIMSWKYSLDSSTWTSLPNFTSETKEYTLLLDVETPNGTTISFTVNPSPNCEVEGDSSVEYTHGETQDVTYVSKSTTSDASTQYVLHIIKPQSENVKYNIDSSIVSAYNNVTMTNGLVDTYGTNYHTYPVYVASLPTDTELYDSITPESEYADVSLYSAHSISDEYDCLTKLKVIAESGKTKDLQFHNRVYDALTFGYVVYDGYNRTTRECYNYNEKATPTEDTTAAFGSQNTILNPMCVGNQSNIWVTVYYDDTLLDKFSLSDIFKGPKVASSASGATCTMSKYMDKYIYLQFNPAGYDNKWLFIIDSTDSGQSLKFNITPCKQSEEIDNLIIGTVNFSISECSVSSYVLKSASTYMNTSTLSYELPNVKYISDFLKNYKSSLHNKLMIEFGNLETAHPEDNNVSLKIEMCDMNINNLSADIDEITFINNPETFVGDGNIANVILTNELMKILYNNAIYTESKTLYIDLKLTDIANNRYPWVVRIPIISVDDYEKYLL